MAHFAEIGADNKVVRVIVADTKEWCENNLGGNWVQTSYNTHSNKHPENRPLHKNYAGVGFHWDGVGFYAPQPYDSWILNEESYIWEAPVKYPEDGKSYIWDESVTNWVSSEV